MKGLEALELLTDSVYYALIECKENISIENKKKYLNAYKIIEKELKALEIIKENSIGCIWKIECSKEKIDFVKEVLL